ncbi:MAG TPA: class I SAM-dependent methyltransferase [Mycobacteriales bacterium]|nr:class I SAM-dependent methyltransferase [Mycobacteriales bacterium]
MTALDRWRTELASWAIPDAILAKAPEPPWGFPVELFRADVDQHDSPSRDVALEALPVGGSVIDVGCGGGAASFALVPPAAHVVGVDSTPDMLTEYAAEAERRGVEHQEVGGTWPEVAAKAGAADVVVCHHVFYNVADLPPFVEALVTAARRRVVVELTASHPLTATAPLWRHFHGIERPDGPTADLALEVLREMGIAPQSKTWSRPPRDVPRDAYVRLNRRRLCLPVEAEPEVDSVMGEPSASWRDVVTIWWDV